jgi:Kef-type K+ transport system membrane component KefB
MGPSLGEALPAVVAIVAAARVLGDLAVRIRQPRIAGEMLSGLLVGGALLSNWRGRHAAVLAHGAVRAIDDLGQLGVMLFLLLVGLALSPGELHRNRIRIAAASLPFVAVAAALAPAATAAFGGGRWQLAGGAVGTIAVAAALTINGFPVVARIMQERGLLHGRLGASTIGASAVLTTVALGLVAVAHWLRPSTGDAAVLSAVELLGAFLAGVALARRFRARALAERALGRIVPAILVPIFLVGAGGRIDVRTLDLAVLAGAVVFTGLLVAVAALGGWISTRLATFDAGEAVQITVLLNCRGMMLFALGAQMSDQRLIGSRLVAVLFLGAVATTLMTGPLLDRVQRGALAGPRA